MIELPSGPLSEATAAPASELKATVSTVFTLEGSIGHGEGDASHRDGVGRSGSARSLVPPLEAVEPAVEGVTGIGARGARVIELPVGAAHPEETAAPASKELKATVSEPPVTVRVVVPIAEP